MAKISIELSELAGRLPTLPDWAQPDDEVVITRDGQPLYRLITAERVDPSGWVPYTVRHPAPRRTTPRPLGTHLGHTKLSPDFNDPCDWDGSPLPKAGP